VNLPVQKCTTMLGLQANLAALVAAFIFQGPVRLGGAVGLQRG
jgi:hypothetical protein